MYYLLLFLFIFNSVFANNVICKVDFEKMKPNRSIFTSGLLDLFNILYLCSVFYF